MCLSVLASMIGVTAWALEPNSEGIYEIANADDLVAFSAMVNAGQGDINGVLMDDIDMSSIENFTPIGSEAKPYGGTFDGKGHVIQFLKVESSGDNIGLFGFVKGGATVRNLILDSTCSIKGGNYVGLVGCSDGAGAVTLSCLGNEGSITAVAANAGGIIGCVSSGTGSMLIERCYNAGHIVGGKESGALSGWIAKKITTINDCYNIGVAEGIQKASKYLYRGTIAAKSNIYSTLGEQEEIISPEIVASGELAWTLNGGSVFNPKFYQNIGEANHPVPVPTQGIVYMDGTSYASFDPNNAESLHDAIQDLIAVEAQTMDNVIAYKGIINEYLAAVDSWYNVTSYEDFCTAYQSAQELKARVDASAALYKNYMDLCAQAESYLNENNFTSSARTILENYLHTDAPASETYPNGTYLHIVEACELDNEAIAAETEFANLLLLQAMATNAVPGTEVTFMLNNFDFKKGFEGWTVESSDMSEMTVGGEKSVLIVARGYKNTFTVSQTLENLPNGIYVLYINGLSRAGSDNYSQLYSGQLFLNENMNFFLTQTEDMVTAETGVDGVNCHLTGSSTDKELTIDDVTYYVPNNMVGCSYAFSGGRYQNYAAMEIKDNKLTVGVCNPGTGNSNDWLPFGNIHVYYAGTAEEANERLTDVLKGYVARAQTILNLEPSTNPDETHMHPNFSAALRQQITDAVAESETATTGAQKMELVNKFSTYFPDVYACRNAYLEMIDAADDAISFAVSLKQLGIMSEDEYARVSGLSDEAWEAYVNGSKTTAEAMAITEQLRQITKPREIATASDLMDFAALVNNGVTVAKGTLTADIDMTGVENFAPIGTEENLQGYGSS